jgi:hypothetical protein
MLLLDNVRCFERMHSNSQYVDTDPPDRTILKNVCL